MSIVKHLLTMLMGCSTLLVRALVLRSPPTSPSSLRRGGARCLSSTGGAKATAPGRIYRARGDPLNAAQEPSAPPSSPTAAKIKPLLRSKLFQGLKGRTTGSDSSMSSRSSSGNSKK